MENNTEVRKIEIEEDSLKDIDTTRKWSMFQAILGFIGIGIMIIAGLFGVLFLSVFNTETSRLGTSEAVLLLVFWGVAILYFFPVLFLFRFSKHAAIAVRALDKTEMQKAFKNLKRYYVYLGVLIIIILVLYFVAFIVAGASVAFLNYPGTGV